MTYSVDLRKRVVDYVQTGGKKTEASHRFRVSQWCVYDWCTRNDLAPTQVPRRKRKLDWEAVACHVQEYPEATLQERANRFGVHKSSMGYACQHLRITRKKRPFATGSGAMKLASPT